MSNGFGPGHGEHGLESIPLHDKVGVEIVSE